MDWKDLLASKIEDGTLEREDYIPESTTKNKPIDVLSVYIDRKGRKGKTATIIEGFSCDNDKLQDIAGSLKSRLGVGGSTRDGEILIQGDHSSKIKTLLSEMGYKVK